VPSSWEKYYEPFLGSAALFFYLDVSTAEISDIIAPLVDTYRAVRRDPERVLDALRPLKPNRKTFDRLKQLAPDSSEERAARFIFLNKACWNGLYRVNSQGIFNVPYGWPRTDFVIDEKNFLRCSAQLRRRQISIRHQDFEEIYDRVTENDFVFLDPPYVTSHNMNGFVDWNESLFSWKDQIRLAKMAKALAAKRANVLITNADHPDVHELYAGFASSVFERRSSLAGDVSRRTRTSEAIFADGPAYRSS
jgi:DNA adenine methylase